MNNKVFLFFCIQFFLCDINAQNKIYFQQKVDYNIKVSLNDEDKTLDGTVDMLYYNNSPDTLSFIWFHLWPNAYKNDKTAFSEQLLKNGRTDFYFSDESKRGYINRLVFKVNGINVRTEDSSAVDIKKIYLNSPLFPKQTIHISTPFHEKLPHNFSRSGYSGKTFQLTQWYPKPAVYDNMGWHPMSYLDQGEFYSEFGIFDVSITIPSEYLVAATGVLQDEQEIKYLLSLAKNNLYDSAINVTRITKANLTSKINSRKVFQENAGKTKTLHYHQDNIHDFAWFANKEFLIQQDTLKLLSGRIINVWSFYSNASKKIWNKSIDYIKESITTRSRWLGEYPYDVVTAVEANMGFSGGMEYPMITSISPMHSSKALETVIEHEVGHNWNYGILATDERTYPWMDEGINTYFDRRFMREEIFPLRKTTAKSNILYNKIPENFDDLLYRNVLEIKKDQPIETISEKFNEMNYNLIAYHKTALWLEMLENYMGRQKLDSAFHTFFNVWKFKHPYPQDVKKIFQDIAQKNIDTIFNLISLKGPLASRVKRKYRISSFFNFNNTDKYNYHFISPSLGFNNYDGIMAGLLIHNITLPANKFQYLVAPLFGTKSKEFRGLSRFVYHWNSYGHIQQIQTSISIAKFSSSVFTDSVGNNKYLSYLKVVPSVRIFFKEKDPRSSVVKFIQWKIYLLKEQNLIFTRDSILQKDMINYPYVNRYINQVRFVIDNQRVLYPFRNELQVEQSTDFARISIVSKYFFNYAVGGGLHLRFFAGKFLYLGDKTLKKQFQTDRYHLNLTGANGYEDYNYSNFFIGRNDFMEFPSQQIMIRDGGFKVRSDLLSSKIGKTDDWLTAINLQSDIPRNINPLQVLPFKIPLTIFLDLGTYSAGFKNNSTGGRFLYDAGFQLSLFKNLLNIYIPVAYSKVYRDYYQSTITQKRFLKTISFSFDLQEINLKKFNQQIFL